MKRTLFVAAIVLGFATAASAATLTVSSNKATYNVGETITLTVSGTNTGESTTQIYGILDYSAALTESVSASQDPHFTAFGMNTWSQGGTAVSDGSATVLNQIAGLNPSQTASGTTSATATLVAESTGVVNVVWRINAGAESLDYFGLTNAPGTSFTIVPEPTVATLIGLGLVGLAVGGRRRSS